MTVIESIAVNKQDYEIHHCDQPLASKMIDIKGRLVSIQQIIKFTEDVHPRLIHANFLDIMDTEHPNIVLGEE